MDENTQFRGLTEHEKETLRGALRHLEINILVNRHLRIAAHAMLEQDMVDNFLWRKTDGTK